jgi:hypothetical protein
MTTIMSPRMLSSLAAYFPSSCAIQEATSTQNSYGEPASTWANKTGYTSIACAVSSAGGKEVKMPNMTYAVASHTVLLAGSYPAITPANRAVVGSLTLDILAVESDPLGTLTRLQCQVVI